MKETKSIRPFIGAKDFDLSRQFYLYWGFTEVRVSDELSHFKMGRAEFYLQRYYVKQWVDNTMMFLEVEDLESQWPDLKNKELDQRFKGVRYVEPKDYDWGREGFLYDPSGILWHIGEFIH